MEGCEGRGEATRNRFEEDDEERPNLREEFRVDQDRLRALHGNAVLSRNPIRSRRLFPHPLTVAGDLSTTGANSTPMSTENML